MHDWAGDDKTITMVVLRGNEDYAKELVKFMYTEVVPYSQGVCIPGNTDAKLLSRCNLHTAMCNL